MNIVSLYVIKTIMRATLLILLVLIGVVVFIELANEMRAVGKGGYGILQAIAYVILIIPRDIYTFFPMAGLVGAILGLGVLASTSELVIMRATGLSIARLSKYVVLAAMLLCLLVTILGEAIGPVLYKQAEYLKANAMYGHQAIETEQGVWMRLGNDYLHIGSVLTRRRLLNVTRYDFSGHKLTKVYFAKHLTYQRKHWLAADIKITTIGEKATKTVHQASSSWDINLKPEVLSFGNDNPTAMSLADLWRYIKYRHNIGLAVNEYWLVFWQRVCQPLATIVMIMLAIPFIFGSSRSGTMGFRILMGIVIGLVFYLFSQLSGQVALVYQVPPILSALLPIVVFSIAGFLLMLRVK